MKTEPPQGSDKVVRVQKQAQGHGGRLASKLSSKDQAGPANHIPDAYRGWWDTWLYLLETASLAYRAMHTKAGWFGETEQKGDDTETWVSYVSHIDSVLPFTHTYTCVCIHTHTHLNYILHILFFACFYGGWHRCVPMCVWRTEDNLQESVLTLYHGSLRN